MSIPIRSVFDRFTSNRKRKPVAAGRAYFCRCGKPVFFRNSICLACNTPLGYEPHLQRVYPLAAGSEPGTWQLASDGAPDGKYLRCSNLDSPAACNWLVSEPEMEGNPRLVCIACRLNRTIPDLSIPENAVWWGRLEGAKRRLVSGGPPSSGCVARRPGHRARLGLRFSALARRRTARLDGPCRWDHHHEHRGGRPLRARAHSRGVA